MQDGSLVCRESALKAIEIAHDATLNNKMWQYTTPPMSFSTLIDDGETDIRLYRAGLAMMQAHVHEGPVVSNT